MASSSMSGATAPEGSVIVSVMPGPCAATVPARIPSWRSFSSVCFRASSAWSELFSNSVR